MQFCEISAGGMGHYELECAASNGNRYPPYPQVMATAISQKWLPPSFAPTLTLEKKKQKKKKKKPKWLDKRTEMRSVINV